MQPRVVAVGGACGLQFLGAFLQLLLQVDGLSLQGGDAELASLDRVRWLLALTAPGP